MGVKVSFFAERGRAAADRARRAGRLVPKAAVRTADGRSVVFVVHDDRVERRAVTVGAADGDQMEIVSGADCRRARGRRRAATRWWTGARVKER